MWELRIERAGRVRTQGNRHSQGRGNMLAVTYSRLKGMGVWGGYIYKYTTVQNSACGCGIRSSQAQL